jgi:hypothetical protein
MERNMAAELCAAADVRFAAREPAAGS